MSQYNQVDEELTFMRSEMKQTKELLQALLEQKAGGSMTQNVKAEPVNSYQNNLAVPDDQMRQSFNYSSNPEKPAPNVNNMRNSYFNPQTNVEIGHLHTELDTLEQTKKNLKDRLNAVEELDRNYRSQLEQTMQKDFENEVSDAYREKQDMQIEKMGKLIADMDNENHNLRKEFEQYKEKMENKKTVEDARTMLQNMKIDKLLAEFIEKYYENPAFHDSFTDIDMIKEQWQGKNMRELMSGLLTFTLHTNFVKKPAAKKDASAVKRR